MNTNVFFWLRKALKYFLIAILAILFAAFVFLFVGDAPRPSQVKWGINFSHAHAERLGLDAKETYRALLDELGVDRVKLVTQWDLLEPIKDQFSFEDLDWQVEEAERRGAQLLLVVGMKTPRYPECHIPDWAKTLSKEEQQREILELVTAIVERYKTSPAIWAWQVENEPLFPFGECPWRDRDFLKREVNLVKQFDPARPAIVSSSGEFTFWFEVAGIGDMVGTTLYRKVWFKELGVYVPYPFPPVFYGRKAYLVEKIFGKRVINVELQAEPWGPVLIYDLPRGEQEKTMNVERFRSVIEYAKKTGLDEFYFWGAEWWYALKEKYGEDTIWNEAKNFFKS